MERRKFLKISALSSAAAALDSCGKPETHLVRFIPDEELIPGVATWKPSVCTLCASGCGLLVRVMEGQAEVVRNGQTGLISMGLAKKLEGNPNNPVNRGKLCAAGQAGLQVTYHPDRLTNPIKRSGARGSGQFQEISWDDALKEFTSQLSPLRSSGQSAALAFVGRPSRGHRQELISRFLKSFGAPAPIEYEPFDEAVLRHANAMSFGHAELPTLDLARADFVISFGADFLGTWNSPVSQSIGYGEMRRGRPGYRGKFVQIEQRMSQTGANADEWIACRPGTEGVLALGLAHVILADKSHAPRNRNPRAASAISGWLQGLPEYAPADVERQTGVAASKITRLAREIAQSGAACAIAGGAPLALSNGLFTALAVNALESLVDTGKSDAGQSGPAIVQFAPSSPFEAAQPGEAISRTSSFSAINALAQQILSDQPHAPKLLMLDGANPVFSAPPSLKVADAIAKVPYIVSFGIFVDETSALADLILPDHSPLESWLDSVPESGAAESVASLAPPALHPLHNTRAMPDVILGVAHQLGGEVAAALPWKTFEEMLHASYVPLRNRPGSINAKTDDEFWKAVQEQGGWWSVASPTPGAARATTTAAFAPPQSGANAPANAGKQGPTAFAEPQFDGAAANFPFYFLPYKSQTLRDGSLANLPWLQELPDVITTAMWSSWVEINPQTAQRLKIAPGDLVEIASQHGSLKAPAVVSPGIAPDLIAMPVGQGHENFGRYASGVGANPLSILAPLTEPQTGSLAWAATRVRIARAGGNAGSKLILFAGGMNRVPLEPEPR